MQLSPIINRTAFLALLSCPLFAYAQESPSSYNQNVTLRFFQEGHDDTCNYYNSTSALTFTTQDIPIVSHCFDFADLFGGNATHGYVNQIWNLGPGRSILGVSEPGIHWSLENGDQFDRTANYSRILYRHHVANPGDDRYMPGHHANVKVTLYGGEGCTERDPLDAKGLVNWFGNSCWSEDEGHCGNVLYVMNSFAISPGEHRKDPGYTCWLHAELGIAVHGFSSARAVMGAFASASSAVWLAR